MSQHTSKQDINQWKQQYYEQLDLLDRKEQNWQALESVLKKTVQRLSIIAEGQHTSIDRYLHDIRDVVKKQVNIIRLENILSDISALVLKLGDKKVAANRKVVTMLMRLLEKTDLPEADCKQKNKLIKKLSRSSDKDSDELVAEVQNLLSVSINRVADGNIEQNKSGLLKKLFKSADNTGDQSENKKTNIASSSLTSNRKTDHVTDYDSIVNGITRLTETLPWPDSLENDVNKVMEKLSACNTGDIDIELNRLFSLAANWQQQAVAEEEDPVIISTDIEEVSLSETDKADLAEVSYSAASSYSMSEAQSQPTAQEMMIQLLEQLTVSPDQHEVVESLKQRIEVENSSTGWKQLLKDIAQLVNTLRSQIQQEKQEFETFLQQITDRLKEIDSFLSMENASLKEAAQHSEDFDIAVSAQVQDIHDDINMADDLDDLKSKVEKRLNIVSDHIRQYRIHEQQRYTSAQQNVENMQSRLAQLEQESDDLKKLIVEKNREAMFDVLTEIPNRLSYEKKAAEEIARCKRFAIPLSMAVWDVDLFKQVNDTYGHKVGDKVLKAIAQLLHERMRETDFLARYGGEEFVMLLPGADEANAVKIADGIREKISACKFKHNDDILKITVSCGISSFVKGDSHELIFERADRALYAAKYNGRNRCMAASSLT
ncbi:MAG: diguanylate cyclase [Gammaproteobacteria bacterium]|nr:diguanylate cyclase [Gammaproteobacteria bacterium]